MNLSLWLEDRLLQTKVKFYDNTYAFLSLDGLGLQVAIFTYFDQYLVGLLFTGNMIY